MPHRISLVHGLEAVEQRQAILDRLVEFNASHTKVDVHPLCIAVLDEDGSVAGGLYGKTMYDWLVIELLFVPEQLRGSGLGSRLVAEAEAQAREHGCVGAWLDTFSFQARGFYEKLGYALAGTIPDHPVGGARFVMLKRWNDPV